MGRQMPNTEVAVTSARTISTAETLVFDQSQITSPINGNNPQWGDACHTLSKECGRTVCIIRKTDTENGRKPILLWR